MITRASDTPLIAAGAVPGYGSIFNAGVIHEDGRFHLFARGVRDGYSLNPGKGARFLNYISDVLVFTSEDGFDYEFQQVLAESHADGVHSYEDPRLQRIRTPDGERVVMTYTNLPAPESGRPWRIGVHRVVYEGDRFALNHNSGRVIGPTGRHDKDAVMFNLRDGRVGLIHRLYPNIQLAVFDDLDQVWASPDDYWADHVAELESHTLIRPEEGSFGVGAGPPPVEVEDGLLFFFHERDHRGHYLTRVALLDDETGRLIAKLDEPLIEPELEWEREGDVDNVVFMQGAVPLPDGRIYLTYGAADRCVGAAYAETGEIVAALRAAA